MFRFLLGIGVGAAIVYFLDAEHGEERRARTNAWVRQYVNSDSIEQARHTTVQQARNLGQQVSQQAEAVSGRVSQYRAGRREASASVTSSGAASALDGAPSGVKA